MESLNVNELYENAMKKKLKKYKTFDLVLSRCYKKIKTYSKNEFVSCLFDIPEFIIGTPIYNLNELIIYIIDSLRKDGLYVELLYHNILYISWDINDKQKKVKKKKETKVSTNVRKVDEYDPSGTFIYNDLAFNDIQKKTMNLFN